MGNNNKILNEFNTVVDQFRMNNEVEAGLYTCTNETLHQMSPCSGAFNGIPSV